MAAIGFGKRSAGHVAREPGMPAPAAAEMRRPLVADETSPDPSQAMRGAGCDAELRALLSPRMLDLLPADRNRDKRRGEMAMAVQEIVLRTAAQSGRDLGEGVIRDTVTVLLNELISAYGGLGGGVAPAVGSASAAELRLARAAASSKDNVVAAKERVHPLLMERIDASVISDMSRGELAEQVSEVISEILVAEKVNLNQAEQRDLVTLLLNDMLGLGPLEPLLADDSVTEIMVNGPKTIFAERKGKISLTDVTFRDDQHLLNIAQRIVSAVGRRVDESSPICDARLLDGSRVNVVIPPLALDGTAISIRKFSKSKLTLEKMVEFGRRSPRRCAGCSTSPAACAMNIIISGGTGLGQDDDAQRDLAQHRPRRARRDDRGRRRAPASAAARRPPRTRPPNLEGKGSVTMRDLVKNALRMRPDRIILGEVRGPEAFDLLQAMNTGHDGSLGTLHANRPREALTRLENMINMAGLNLPPKAIRQQITDAVNMVIQISRMRDGKRRVTHISEIVGMEGDVITMQDLYLYQQTGEDEQGMLRGDHVSTGLRPAFYERAEYYGLGRALMECM